MAKDLARLVVRLEAQSERLIKELEKSNRNVNRFASNTKKSMDFAKKAIGSLAAAFASVKIAQFIKSAYDAGDQIQKLALRTKATTEELSQMRFVVERGGSSLEAYANSLRRLEKSTSDAQVGLSTAVRGFQQLGIETKDFAQLSAQKKFEIMADALNNISNQSDKTRIAMDLMGRSGTEMLSVMAGGSKEISALREEADRLGYTLSQADADQMAAVKDAMTNLKTASMGLANTIAVQLGPSIVELLNSLARDTPSAVNRSVMAYTELEAKYYDIKAAIIEALVWRDKWDQKVLKAIPGGEKFAEKFIGYDPKKLREDTAVLNETRQKIADIRGKIVDLVTKEYKPFNIAPGKAFSDLFDKNIAGEFQSSISGPDIKGYQSLVDSMRSQEEVIAASYAKRAEIIQNARNANLIDADRENALLVTQQAIMYNDIAKITKDGLDKIDALNRQHRDDMLSNTASLFGSLSDIVGAGSKRAFELSKQLARAQTLVSTYSAAQKAFESQIIIGDPTSLGRAYMAAGAAVAAGLARLVQINRTSFTGGGAGGGAQPIYQASPSTGLPSQQTYIRTDEKAAASVVNINVSTVDATGFERVVQNNRGVIIDTVQTAYDQRGAVGGPRG